MSIRPPRPLGECLLQNKLITEQQLAAAIEHQQRSSQPLGQVLTDLGFLNEEQVLDAVALQRQVRLCHPDELCPGDDVKTVLPASVAEHLMVCPLREVEGALVVASSDPWDLVKAEALSLLTGFPVKMVLASRSRIRSAIHTHYGIGSGTIDRMVEGDDLFDETAGTSLLDEDAASIGAFLNEVLHEAVCMDASDVHFEPSNTTLSLRYRINGMLYDAHVPAQAFRFCKSLVSHLKILCQLDISESRTPQDGRFRFKSGREDIDVRASFLPVRSGESVVLRLLNSRRLITIEELGLDAGQRSALRKMIHRGEGVIFLTGPTGSGKTTTLYACLNALNEKYRKIITIEDPVEYSLPGVMQMQINPPAGLHFANGLRSMLRHDSNVMMVGEVRDSETAHIAVHSALTGHLVLSTLHTNDAASGAVRLHQMGVEPYLVASSVIGFIGQRLLRVLCAECRAPADRDRDCLSMPREHHDVSRDGSRLPVYESRGCRNCHFTGFSGSTAVYEFLVFDDEIRDMVAEKTSAGRIRKYAVQQGMRLMRDHAWQKVSEGITSPSEVLRVFDTGEGSDAG